MYVDNIAHIVDKNVSSVDFRQSLYVIIEIRKNSTNKERGTAVFIINIVERETEEVINTLEEPNFRLAEKLRRGISINLNHEEFRVDIIEQ